MSSHAVSAPGRGSPNLAAGVLGFALGGFIDGILLHQVLQWHHLLSLVEGEALRDLRVQILADGLFHVLMYAIAILGLWLLWRARGGITGRRADLRIVASALLGFGVWQLVDVVGFHWIMRIHRIRVDVPNPLFWDLAWLVVFAVPSLAAGWWLMRRAGPSEPDGPDGPALRRVPAALAALVLVAGPVALLPPPGSSTAMVVFRPGVDSAQAFAAVAAADGRVLWSSRDGDVLAVDLAGASVGPLYANGAMLVSTSTLLAGCLAWSRV
ncbi:MAG: hypothetical protein JWR08_2084 [Enterovirga sp.]|jgi:uncharacterized membrane protein|nr:hypothetical protein [Enterovirga sp.]